MGLTKQKKSFWLINLAQISTEELMKF